MKEYKVLKPVNILDGTIKIDAVMAKKRRRCLTPVKNKKDTYTVMLPVMFKAGETVWIDSVSKVHLPNLEDVAAVKAEAEAKAKEDKK